MKIEKLRQIGAGMSEKEIEDSIRSLGNDRRFAAVVELLRRQKDLASDGAAQLKFANSHGCLAHASGVRYAMMELEGKIKQICETPKRRGAAAPPANAEPEPIEE